ncbi:hypothetical protein [Trinickia dinghuensis]|uniref:Uncharacterized protein n=1 Tax=Trinickia dinghuensis TaxID=2291023 RepID=A0A3D8JUE0_9BURK|nr:hypothetical protein [Trinickia dinghuensis]RDU96678.1 hypothetical protein DWV00_22005 [Trinickia dinghuensis]
MSLGIDVAACVSSSGASGVGAVGISGHSVACTASDGTQGTLGVMHMALVDNSAETTPFDYTQAAGFWGLAFCFVVGLYFVTRGIGALVEFIRRG